MRRQGGDKEKAYTQQSRVNVGWYKDDNEVYTSSSLSHKRIQSIIMLRIYFQVFLLQRFYGLIFSCKDVLFK